MKNLFYITLIASLLGCTDSDNLQTRTFSFLVDRTEDNLIPPTASYLLDRLPESDSNDGLEICYGIIGDTPYTKSQCFVLSKGETGILANEATRRKDHRLLKKQFTDSVAIINAKEYSFERSDIFRTMVGELEKLSKKEGLTELWLFSDLQEHSFFSVYDPKQQYQLFHDLDKVVQTFEAQIDFKRDVSGIQIRIIHNPELEDLELFSQMILLYRTILEPHGIVIQIGLENQIRISK